MPPLSAPPRQPSKEEQRIWDDFFADLKNAPVEIDSHTRSAITAGSDNSTGAKSSASSSSLPLPEPGRDFPYFPAASPATQIPDGDDSYFMKLSIERRGQDFFCNFCEYSVPSLSRHLISSFNEGKKHREYSERARQNAKNLRKSQYDGCIIENSKFRSASFLVDIRRREEKSQDASRGQGIQASSPESEMTGSSLMLSYCKILW